MIDLFTSGDHRDDTSFDEVPTCDATVAAVAAAEAEKQRIRAARLALSAP